MSGFDAMVGVWLWTWAFQIALFPVEIRSNPSRKRADMARRTTRDRANGHLDAAIKLRKNETKRFRIRSRFDFNGRLYFRP